MGTIVLVDTSVLLNILNVPAFNQRHKALFQEFTSRLASGETLLLPLAAVFETGNHIAQLADGGERRRYAGIFASTVKDAINGEAPWTPMGFPDPTDIADWMDKFPYEAMRGRGMADVSVIKDWERTCRQNPRARVQIWSIDNDLAGFDHDGRLRRR